MATFSTNQARQILVAAQVNSSLATKGDINLVAPESADYIYFDYKGPDTRLRSDLIKKDLITSATLTHGKNIEKYLKKYEVTLKADINSGNPVVGQEYILRIDLIGYASLGVENTYQKYGYVKVTSGMTAAQFYTALAASLTNNFKREAYPVLTFTASTTKLTIEEVSMPWHLGTDQDLPQAMQIFTDYITVDGMDQHWGTVTEITDKANLTPREDSVYRQLADLEYFLMGERADKFRMVGFPYVIYTDYMIDNIGVAKNSNAFGIIDIHYSYVGSNEAVQKSEKDLCIVAPYTVSETIAKAIVGAGVPMEGRSINGKPLEITSSTVTERS